MFIFISILSLFNEKIYIKQAFEIKIINKQLFWHWDILFNTKLN